MKLMLFDIKDSSHPYGVRFTVQFTVRAEMVRWCTEQFGRDVSLGILMVAFRHEADRNWFILRWS